MALKQITAVTGRTYCLTFRQSAKSLQSGQLQGDTRHRQSCGSSQRNGSAL
ncbi:hypothetical protein PCURB6_39000 [Paenibacillus curdlanolyticus]|nr:hypothetical protein PCURB6_39000 [Paenibacillus curdlanolyticus]